MRCKRLVLRCLIMVRRDSSGLSSRDNNGCSSQDSNGWVSLCNSSGCRSHINKGDRSLCSNGVLSPGPNSPFLKYQSQMLR